MNNNLTQILEKTTALATVPLNVVKDPYNLAQGTAAVSDRLAKIPAIAAYQNFFVDATQGLTSLDHFAISILTVPLAMGVQIPIKAATHTIMQYKNDKQRKSFKQYLSKALNFQILDSKIGIAATIATVGGIIPLVSLATGSPYIANIAAPLAIGIPLALGKNYLRKRVDKGETITFTYLCKNTTNKIYQQQTKITQKTTGLFYKTKNMLTK